MQEQADLVIPVQPGQAAFDLGGIQFVDHHAAVAPQLRYLKCHTTDDHARGALNAARTAWMSLSCLP